MIDVRQKLYDELVVHHESRVDRWHENYNRFTKDINLVKERVQKEDARLSQDSLYQGLSSLSEPSYKGFLWKLIGEKNNGISSRGRSVLSREHLAEFKENP